jgi:hypothetical protein
MGMPMEQKAGGREREDGKPVGGRELLLQRGTVGHGGGVRVRKVGIVLRVRPERGQGQG